MPCNTLDRPLDLQQYVPCCICRSMVLAAEKFQTFLEETPIPRKVELVTRAGYVPLVIWSLTRSA